jgi:hypothetical protein
METTLLDLFKISCKILCKFQITNYLRKVIINASRHLLIGEGEKKYGSTQPSYSQLLKSHSKEGATIGKDSVVSGRWNPRELRGRLSEKNTWYIK